MADLNHSISVEYAREILDYNPETGEFRWKRRNVSSNSWNYRFAGKVAGTMNARGYIKISINNCLFSAHKLAWLMFYGDWPHRQLDHRDNNRVNNRIINLRLATNQENSYNRNTHKNNTSGFPGVLFHKHRKKWCASIRANGRPISLGYFLNIEDAVIARKQAEIKYFGEFRRGAA